MNRSMPSAIIIPELAYPDVGLAVEWLCQVFSFTERLRIGTHRAQLLFGEGSIIVTQQQSDPGRAESSHAIMVRVTDIDSHFERAKQAGANIVRPLTDYPYGERQYTVRDLADHQWVFSPTIADIDPQTWGGVLVE